MAGRQGAVRIGPVSILVLTIMLCLAVMSVLAFTTAEAEKSITIRQDESTVEMYANEREAQTFLARLDSALATSANPAAAIASIELPTGADFNGRILTLAFTQPGGRRLDIEIAFNDRTYNVLSWRASTEWNEEEDPDMVFWTNS